MLPLSLTILLSLCITTCLAGKEQSEYEERSASSSPGGSRHQKPEEDKEYKKKDYETTEVKAASYKKKPEYMQENYRDKEPASYKKPERGEEYKDKKGNKDKYLTGKYYYGGHYEGKCGQDGFYYMDDESFVVCSNENAYVQACAPGTRNSGRGHYNKGYHYGYSDFCDVNLVDYGYNSYGHNGGYPHQAAMHPMSSGYPYDETNYEYYRLPMVPAAQSYPPYGYVMPVKYGAYNRGVYEEPSGRYPYTKPARAVYQPEKAKYKGQED